MLTTTIHYDDFCNLIISLLESAFNINTTKICDSSGFLDPISLEFRKITKPNFDFNVYELSQMKRGILHVMHSSMEFTTIIFSMPKDISEDILIIGPFFEIEPNDKFITHLIKNKRIPEHMKKTFSTYFQTLPIVNSINVITTLHRILSQFISDYDASLMNCIDFSKDKSSANDYPLSDDSAFYVEYHKRYKSCLDKLFQQIRFGKDATDTLNEYMELTGLLKSNSIEKIKNNLYILNTQLESELLKEYVSIVPIRQLSLTIQCEIEHEYVKTKLMKLPYRMLRKYSELVLKEHMQDYSYTVRSAIEYMNLNLQHKISLSSIAASLKKNPNFLSTQFKKETGMTITQYVQEMRMEEAKRMLRNTNMSVQEIAHLVGIEDLSWFSKLFKGIVGESPREYRGQGRKE